MTDRDQWQRDGYLVLRNILDPATLLGLREAAEHAFAQWRVNSSADNQPSQHWYSPDAWVMIHLNHPKYYIDREEFLTRLLNAIGTPQAINSITQIMGETPIFMQANLYIDSPQRAFMNGGMWHRDCQFYAKGDEAVEKRLLTEEAEPPRELHMHIPLVATSATGIVPSSHNRWDTPQESHARRHASGGDMPGGIRLPLNPGDIAFFHVNAIHRGYYEVGTPRRTIAITFGSRSKYRPFDEQWWKATHGYVSTFQPWFRKPGYLANVEPHTAQLFQNFINTYSDQWRPENLHPEAIGSERLKYFTLY